MAEQSGGGGGLYFRKDTRVDFQWIVRKKVRVFSFKFEIELIYVVNTRMEYFSCESN